jgi:hypothetical protein
MQLITQHSTHQAVRCVYRFDREKLTLHCLWTCSLLLSSDPGQEGYANASSNQRRGAQPDGVVRQG